MTTTELHHETTRSLAILRTVRVHPEDEFKHNMHLANIEDYANQLRRKSEENARAGGANAGVKKRYAPRSRGSAVLREVEV